MKRWAILNFVIGLLLVSTVQAASFPISDYTYKYRVHITNGTGGTLDAGTPILLAGESGGINSGQLYTAGYVDRAWGFQYAWDIYTVDSSLNEVELMAQDLDVDPAHWWIPLPTDLADGSTLSVWLYTGNAFAQRDQQFVFSGSDYLLVSHHADFSLGGAWSVTVTVSTDDPTQDIWLVNKYDSGASHGYKFGLHDNAGVSQFRATVDATTLDVTYGTGWDGSELTVKMRFANPNLYIDYLDPTTETWTNLDSVNTGLGSPTANAEDIIMGNSFTGLMSDVEITSSNSVVALWTFDAADVSESSAVNPNYDGTILNADNPGTHDATYTMSRDQTDITVTIDPMQLVSAGDVQSLTSTQTDVVGDIVHTDIFTRKTTAQKLPFYSTIEAAQVASGLTRDAFWILALILVSALGMTGVWFLFPHHEFVMIVPTVSFVLAGTLGLLAPLFAVLGGLGCLSFGLLWRRSRE